MAETNMLTGGLKTDFYNLPTVQQSPAAQNPLTGMLLATQAASATTGLQQQQFNLGHARLNAVHDEMGALATVPGGPSYDQVMQRITGMTQSGMLGPGEVQKLLPNIPTGDGAEGNAARKSFFDQQLQITGGYKDKMAGAYGAPSTMSVGDKILSGNVDPRSGAFTPSGQPQSLGLSPDAKIQRYNGVANGVPYSAPVGPGFTRTGDLMPPAPQAGMGASSTMAPRGVSVSQAPPPVAGPVQPNMMGARAPGASGTMAGGLPPGAVQSQQGPGIDATANAQAVANQGRAAALQDAAARVPDTKAILDRLDMHASAFTAGPASPLAKKLGGYANQAAGAVGMEPPISSQAAREAFDKDAALLAGQQSAALGGTDAGKALAQVMTPGASNTNEGIKNITAVLKGNQDAIAAKGAAWDNYRRAFPPGQADYGHFETQFHQTFSPRAFAMVYQSPAERQKTWASMSSAEQAQVQKSYDAAKAAGYLKPPGAAR